MNRVPFRPRGPDSRSQPCARRRSNPRGNASRARRSTASEARGEVEGLVRELAVTVVPFGEIECRVAVDAFLRFGRGRHPAGLNFGDCLAYASAVAARDTLLFVGDDLRKTDVVPA